MKTRWSLSAMLVLVACVLSIVMAVAVACGDGSGGGGAGGDGGLRNDGEVPALPTIYTDPTYGYSMQIDGTFTREDASSSSDPADYSMTWMKNDGPVVDGQVVDGIAISIEDRGAEMTSAEVEALTAAMRDEEATLEAMLGYSTVVTGMEEATIGESPALIVDATSVGPDRSTPVTARIAYVFEGQYVFTIWCSATTGTWAENEPLFQASILSFTAQ